MLIRLAQTASRLVREDSAQDLVEYAYLAAFVGLAGLLVWTAIVGLLGDRYTDYNTGVQGLWESPTP